MDADTKNRPETADPIQVVQPCCCGLDAHKRAGADLIITYHAPDVACWMDTGRWPD